jgi:two-component system nitrogen regulation response regulator GlnG
MTVQGSEDIPTANISTVDVRRESGGAQPPRLLPALTIVSHPSPQRTGERLVLHALAQGQAVALSRNAPDFMHPGGGLAQSLADPFLSRSPLMFTPGPEGSLVLEASESGRVSIADVPLRGSKVLSPQEIAAGVPLGLADRVVLLLHLADPKAAPAADTLGMVGNSLGLQRVRHLIEQVADLDVPVLIRGETGSGKELIAQAIYRRSPRRDRPFISVNLGAIPKELATAELFGAVKGAYSGAVNREGLFRAAHGGTLFLDEVGEAPPEVQVILLRVLDAREFFPVGSPTPVATDVRLVTATDAHLEKQIQEGRFKEPLLHRLAGYDIRVPPLRERREDIGPLFLHFAREELEAIGEGYRLGPAESRSEPWLSASLASWLVRYSWPGNIRQLRNVTRQIIISSRGQPGGLRLDPRLEQELSTPLTPPASPAEVKRPDSKGPSQHKVSDIPEQQLIAALEVSGWEIKPAAEQLGVARSSLQDWYQRNICPTLSPEQFSRSYQESHQDVDTMSQRLRMSRWSIVRRLKELGILPQT